MNSKFFNGTLVIMNNGKVIETWNIVNNVANYKSQPLQSQRTITTYLAETPSCTVSTVHDCVAYKINDMNAVEYLLCLGSAPGCYGGLWAICTYDVCTLGKT